MKKCKCGFKFAGAGEYRNCDAFITENGKSGIICSKCDKRYIEGKEVKVDMKEISAKEYNKLMERVIRLNDKLEVHEQLIKMLEEAAKYKIKERRR